MRIYNLNFSMFRRGQNSGRRGAAAGVIPLSCEAPLRLASRSVDASARGVRITRNTFINVSPITCHKSLSQSNSYTSR
jgi:hypothetical protein